MHKLHRLKEEVAQSSILCSVFWALGDLWSDLYSRLLCIFSLHLSSSAVKHQDSNASLPHGHLSRLRIIKAEPQAPAVARTPESLASCQLCCWFVVWIWWCPSTPFFLLVSVFCKNRDGKSHAFPPLLNDLRHIYYKHSNYYKSVLFKLMCRHARARGYLLAKNLFFLVFSSLQIPVRLWQSIATHKTRWNYKMLVWGRVLWWIPLKMVSRILWKTSTRRNIHQVSNLKQTGTMLAHI